MMTKPKILLVAQRPSNLGNALINKLARSGYQVDILTKDLNLKNIKNINDFRYIICLTDSVNQSIFSGFDTRILLVLPYSKYSSTRGAHNNPKVTTAYVGDIYNSQQLNLITNEIVRLLFSFGNGGREVIITKDVKPQKPMKRVKRNKIVLLTSALVAGFILLPYFIFLLSLPEFYLAVREAKKGNLNISQKILTVNAALLNCSTGIFGLYDKVPIVGVVFEPMFQLSAIAGRSSRIGQEAIDTVKITRDLTSKILGKEIYSPSNLSNNLVLDLDYLYNQMSLLQADLLVLPNWQKRILNKYVSENQVQDLVTKLYWSRSFARQLPAILGEGRPQSYLILFQNNMELRATGGFIGSFAVITMDGGRLTNINVTDVYTADGQLKGYVEPPAPIKNYLGEAAWYLRDSNWDPDFPTSAAKAEWFLEKEIDKSVEGVIAVDLEVAKSILKVTGPIKLADYGLMINANNLYERTQTEVEKDFFPGSTKKSNFLTALTKELLNRASVTKESESLSYLNSFYSNLQEKHIQIFLHNTVAQKFVRALGYDGAVVQPSCAGNCYADWLGLVDANVGVNKSNLFIKRDARLSIQFNKESITRSLTVNYENTATPALGDKARYKTYTRVLLPTDAEVGDGKIATYAQTLTAQLDIQNLQGRTEVGVLLEIMPGEKTSYQLIWSTPNNLDFDQKGEYRLYWRKQAGSLADPIAIEIGDLDKYNTSLSQDLFRTVTW